MRSAGPIVQPNGHPGKGLRDAADNHCWMGELRADFRQGTSVEAAVDQGLVGLVGDHLGALRVDPLVELAGSSVA